MPNSVTGSTSPTAASTPAVAAYPAGPALLLGVFRVVFGDIGTSPIYAFHETGMQHNRVVAERVPRIAEAKRLVAAPLAMASNTSRYASASPPRRHPSFSGTRRRCPQCTRSCRVGRKVFLPFMTRNAVRASDYFLIPPPRVVELGTRVEL